MEKILITCGTRPFAQRVSKLLSFKYTVLFGSSEVFPDVLLKTGYRKIPTGRNPTFAHELLKLCLDEGCQFVLPLSKQELAGLHQARVLFAEYGIHVLIPESLEETTGVEDPAPGLLLQVFNKGEDLVTGIKLPNSDFSGVGIQSDDQEAIVLCLT